MLLYFRKFSLVLLFFVCSLDFYFIFCSRFFIDFCNVFYICFRIIKIIYIYKIVVDISKKFGGILLYFFNFVDYVKVFMLKC